MSTDPFASPPEDAPSAGSGRAADQYGWQQPSFGVPAPQPPVPGPLPGSAPGSPPGYQPYGSQPYGGYGGAAYPPYGTPFGYPQVAPGHALAQNGQQVRLASAGARIGSFFLSLLLVIATLVVGYLVWTLVLWGSGRTPSKQILHQRVVTVSDGMTASWGRMAVRGFLVGGVLTSLFNAFTFGIYSLVDAFFVFSSNHQRLTDRIAGTYVVQD